MQDIQLILYSIIHPGSALPQPESWVAIYLDMAVEDPAGFTFKY